MAILPGLDELADILGLSKTETRWIAACQYFVIVLDICVFCWLIYSIWKILVE